ncbi:MAG: alpha/beta hydrolase [Terracidiphilus sp.]
MIWKIFKFVVAATVCLVVAALSTALFYRLYLRHKVAEDRAIHSPQGIDSLESVRIGGIDQWIEVRGQNVNNPILLFIHGGPGIAFIPLAGSFQAPLEQHFTVVEWDQRGAGKTYTSNDKDLQRRTMNAPQMEQDTLEVVNYLRNRFKRDKIVVVGHSWGSVLGLWLAHEHPDLIYAYVGVGQIVNMWANAEAVYKDDLQQARSLHNEQAVKELEAIAPYPGPNADMGKMFVANKWAGELLGPPPSKDEFTDVKRILTDVASAPEYSLADDVGFVRGQMFSGQILFPQLSEVDLTKLGPDFKVPIFFFEGRRDPYCRPALIEEYSQTISAPKRELIWFDHSGHFPFYEEKQKFADELVQRVLPLATNR